MPWSGGTFTRTNGVHTGSTLWAQDRDAGTKILATRHDTHDQDLADGINSTLEKSGSNAATGNLDIGSNRITLVADGTAKTDVATVNQIQSNGPAFQATDTGTANAYVIALSPAITAYAAGQAFTFKAGAASTTASTLNVNGLGTKAIKKLHDQDIASGDIESGSIVTVVYDGTNFQATSQLASTAVTSPGGSNTQVQYNSSGSFAGSANFTFDGTSATLANALFLPDGTSGAPALSNTGDTNTGAYFPDADQLGVVTGATERFRYGSNPVAPELKNLLVNGDFSVDQRNKTTSVTGADSYTLDMVEVYEHTDGALDVSQDTDTPAGGDVGSADSVFAYSLKLDVTTAESSIGAGQYTYWDFKIEAQFLQNLAYGTAGAKPITLSFWTKATKTGVHCGSIYQQDATRYYIFEYTIASTNTWEYFTVTIPGDTSGQIDTNTGPGMRVRFSQATGSNNQGSKDAWTAGNELATSSAVNDLDSTSNNIFFAGCQLEIGDVATSFGYRPFGLELNLCQRYFERRDWADAADQIAHGASTYNQTSACTLHLQQVMRTSPTITLNTASTYRFVDQTNTVTVASGASSGAISPTTFALDLTHGTNPAQGGGYMTAVSATYFEASAEM